MKLPIIFNTHGGKERYAFNCNKISKANPGDIINLDHSWSVRGINNVTLSYPHSYYDIVFKPLKGNRLLIEN
jgi:hypothetical protein